MIHSPHSNCHHTVNKRGALGEARLHTLHYVIIALLAVPQADALLEAPESQILDSDDASARHDRWAMRLSFWANVLLLVLKVFISVHSGSLSIIVSTLDSVLDIISGLILYLTSAAMRRRNKYKFPIGKVGP